MPMDFTIDYSLGITVRHECISSTHVSTYAMIRPLSRHVGGFKVAHVVQRQYATHPPKARLNIPTDYAATPLLHHTSKSALANPELPQDARNGTTSRINLFQSINTALSHALRSDPRVLLFGEDVAFGGVFRCSMNLATEFGEDRVFNTPLSEQGLSLIHI